MRLAKEAGKAAEVHRAGKEAQEEAKAFISLLMGGDGVGPDGGNPSVEELADLTATVRGLSEDSLSIVASITGAPSVASFREGFELLSPTDLKSMRQLFRRMGLHGSA